MNRTYSKFAPKDLVRLAQSTSVLIKDVTMVHADDFDQAISELLSEEVFFDVGKIKPFVILDVLLSKDAEVLMRPVWRALSKRTIQKGHEDEEGALAAAGMHLWNAVTEALSPPSPKNRRTRKQHYEELRKIANKTRELELLVRQNSILGSTSLLELISQVELAMLCGNRSSHHDGNHSTEQSTTWDSPAPHISQLLRSLANRCDELTMTNPLVKQARAKNYEAIYFSRYMTREMLRQYGQPLHVTVAAVGSLFFGDVMTEEFVRKNAAAITAEG